MRIIEGNLSNPRIVALLRLHVTTARAQTAPGNTHALDMAASSLPTSNCGSMDGEELPGFGALKFLRSRNCALLA